MILVVQFVLYPVLDLWPHRNPCGLNFLKTQLYNKVTFDLFLVKKAINNCCLKFRDNAKNDAVQNVDLRLLHSQ